MNLKWLKQNAVLVGFIAAFVIVLAGVIWLQQAASTKRADVEGAIDEQSSQLQHLLQMELGPSHENINIVKRDREQVDRLYSNLFGAVSHHIDTAADLRPVSFLQLMASSFARLQQAAAAAGIKLPEGFAFGFGRYAGPPPTLPARGLPEEDTKRVLSLLVKQLTAIDQISSLLITNRVDEINQIRRSEVEPGTASETIDQPISTDPKMLYQILPFEFQFTCTSEALRAFLNSLTKSEWFLVVRRVQVTGEAPSSEKASTSRTGPGAAASQPIATAPKRERLAVTMRIDLIDFSSRPPVKKEAVAVAVKRASPPREE
jgi:hypothetical protein